MEATQVWCEGDITAWLFPLTVSADELFELWEFLSPFEFAQAEAHAKIEFRSRFIVRRGMLRKLLGKQLKLEPNDLHFQIEEFGKPYVAGYPIHFSASSSEQFGMVACSLSHRVGVDIENHKEVLVSSDFHLLTDSEARFLRDAQESPDVFFKVWARKEACVKAIGQGVRFKLGELDVLPDDSDRCCVRVPQQVVVSDIKSPPGYSAAVAWEA